MLKLMIICQLMVHFGHSGRLTTDVHNLNSTSFVVILTKQNSQLIVIEFASYQILGTTLKTFSTTKNAKVSYFRKKIADNFSGMFEKQIKNNDKFTSESDFLDNYKNIDFMNFYMFVEI